jgi:drug/metabolite transporter (DMT)-like permease
MFTFGLIAVFPIGIGQFSEVDWHSFDSTIWVYAIFVVIGTTFIAYLLNVYALKDLSPAVVSAYIYLQPVLTAVLAISTGNDTISIYKVLSALMIFVGVWLVSRKQKNILMD